MLVRMTSTRTGSPDGIRSIWYREGQVYDLPDSLLSEFLKAGWCVSADIPVKAESPKARRAPQMKREYAS